MITHDCTTQKEVIRFMKEESPTAKSDWFLRYFRTRTTDAEKLEFRDYSETDALPLLYTGACLPPNLIKEGSESVTVMDISFPVMKAITHVDGCDIKEMAHNADGTVTPVGRQRFEKGMKKGVSRLLKGLKATHTLEAIELIRTGGYVLDSSDTENLGTIDLGRAEELKIINLVGTEEDFSSMCSNPIKVFNRIINKMAQKGGIAGKVDIIYSELAWTAMETHAEREAIKFNTQPTDQFTKDLIGYNDVQFMGETNGRLNHWVSTAKYIERDGTVKPVVEAGEIIIISRDGFDGQRVFRNITSDNAEKLPEGATFFLYDGLDKEYDRFCRAFKPWIEEYHLMVAKNVNGATVVKVVPEDFVACVACEVCDKSEEL